MPGFGRASTALLLLAGGLVAGLLPGFRQAAADAGARFQDTAGYAARVLNQKELAVPQAPSPGPLRGPAERGALSAGCALLLAWATLFRDRLPLAHSRPIGRAVKEILRPIRALHSGHVGDYMAWLTLGAATFGGLCALLLR